MQRVLNKILKKKMSCSNCNKNCNGKCGCQDAALTTPNYILPECSTQETCSEVLNTNCVVYTGTPISSGSTVVVNTNDTVSEAFASIVDNIPISPYKVLRGLITQTGTSTPTITILENTLGVTATPGRFAVGEYGLTFSASILLSNKTYYNFQINADQNYWTVIPNLAANNLIYLTTYYSDSETCCQVKGDGILTNAPFEILVYA